MKKLITIILIASATADLSGFSQTNTVHKKPTELTKSLNRLLYEHYFKSLYKYEPSTIRENKIAYIEVKWNQKLEDSLIDSQIKQKVTFRKDGRPIQMIEWNQYHQDSLIMDYSYDSLGDLIEYRYWIPEGYGGKVNRDIAHRFFNYNDKHLTKVFSYSRNNGRDCLTLDYCDSLSYKLNEQKVSIFRGNANDSTIIYIPGLKFIYPVSSVKHYTFNAKKSVDKPFDKESLWETDCVYQSPVLKELQRLTGIQCLNNTIINACNGVKSFWDLDSTTKIPTFTFDRKSFSMEENAIFADTLKQEIYLKQNFTIRQSTSLEDRITSTQSIQSYDYSLRLLQTESVRENSRGQREYSKDSSQTFYSYYNFGIVQRKLEFHYFNNSFKGFSTLTFGDSEIQQKGYNRVDVEETDIKTWVTTPPD